MNDERDQFLRALLKAVKGINASVETLEMLILRELEDAESTSPSADPDVLGIDTLGRVIKRRKLSPEVIAKKRKLMNQVREQRLRDAAELKKLREEKTRPI